MGSNAQHDESVRTTGPVAPSSADPLRLGHFRIVSRLGHGGMGVVYRAVDEKLHRDVALKLLTTGIGDDDDRRRRFEREARAVAALSHPNIVSVHSVDQVDGHSFLVMEFVDGRTVADITPKGGFEPARLLEIAIPIVAAVAAAHDHGVVHRDLKPQNVMITETGSIKVLDFGLAKLAEPAHAAPTTFAPTMTGEGRILGTPAYMSPEQAEGKPVDARSDVFSLGVMLYELASGALPFSGASTISLITSVLRDEPTPLHERRPALPPQLWRIVRRCLMKDPKRRYQSTGDLLNDLEELRAEALAGALAPTVPPPALVVPAPPKARWPLAAGGAALAVLGVLAGRLSHDPPAPAAVAPSSSGKAAAPRFTKFTRITTTSTSKTNPVLSPDGKWVVFGARSGDKRDLYRQRVGGANATNLTASSGSDETQPAISPDGESIAFRSSRDGGGIFVMGSTGESARRLTDFGFTPSWSPDGKQLVVSTVAVEQPMSRLTHGELWLVDAATGAKRKLDTGEDSTLPAFSPDGRFVAYHYWDGYLERGIAVVSASGGKPIHAFRGLATWTPAWSPDGKYVYASVVRIGDSNVWRIPFDGGAFRFGEAEPVTTALGFVVAYPSLAQDGTKLLLSGTHVSSNLYKIRFDAASLKLDGALAPLTRGSNRFGDLSVSPDGNWIVFGSGGFGDYASTQEDLYIARVDGSERRQLTNDAPYDRSPRWTADGKRIFFYSQRGEALGPGTWSISRDSLRAWSIAPDGSQLTLLVGRKGQEIMAPVPSPVGTLAAAFSWNRGVVFDTAKPPDQKLDELPPIAPGDYFYPASWSPDGKILYGSDLEEKSGQPTASYAFDLEKRSYRKLGPANEQIFPLHDGRHLLYTEGPLLGVIDAADGSTRTLLDPTPDFIDAISLSADERWLYLSLVSVDGDLWLAEPE